MYVRLMKAEKTILSCMVHAKPFVKDEGNLAELFTEDRKEFYEFLYEKLKETVDGKNLVQEFYAKFSNENSDRASEIVNYLLMTGNEEFDNVAYKDSLWKLVNNYYKAKIISKKKKNAFFYTLTEF